MHGDKFIHYGTPRAIVALKKNQQRTHWHNKNKLCIKTKGEHEYTEVETEFLFDRPWKKQWKCKCGKKGKYEFIDKPKWLK